MIYSPRKYTPELCIKVYKLYAKKKDKEIIELLNIDKYLLPSVIILLKKNYPELTKKYFKPRYYIRHYHKNKLLEK